MNILWTDQSTDVITILKIDFRDGMKFTWNRLSNFLILILCYYN